MRGLFRLVLAATLFVGATSVKAAPATNLVISYCGPQVVQNCLPSIHYFNTPISFWVLAVDSTGALATNYTGTVVIGTTPSASISPASHTFTLADNSSFLFSTQLNVTLSGSGVADPIPLFVSATDTANSLSGAAVFSLVPPPKIVATAAPMLSTPITALLVFGLACIGFIMQRKTISRS